MCKSYRLSIKNFKYISDIWSNDKSKPELDELVNQPHKLLKYLENFRSINITTAYDCFYSDYRNSRIILSKFLETYEEGSKFLNKILLKDNVGKDDNAYKFRDNFFTSTEIFHADLILSVLKFAKLKKINNILEIGGGYGVFAKNLNKLKDNLKYIIIDLPFTNMLSAYYLKKAFPKKSFFLMSDYVNSDNYLSYKNYQSHDFCILTPQINNKSIDLDTRIKFDFALNTNSFMEMKKVDLNKYFELIHERLKVGGYLLNNNRYYDNNSGDRFGFINQPYDKKWKVIISKKNQYINHFHLLLTQRLSYNNLNFKKKFDDIKKISLKYKKNKLYETLTNYNRLLSFFAGFIGLLLPKRKLRHIGYKLIKDSHKKNY